MCGLAGVGDGWRWQLEGVVNGDDDDDGGEKLVVVGKGRVNGGTETDWKKSDDLMPPQNCSGGAIA